MYQRVLNFNPFNKLIKRFSVYDCLFINRTPYDLFSDFNKQIYGPYSTAVTETSTETSASPGKFLNIENDTNQLLKFSNEDYKKLLTTINECDSKLLNSYSISKDRIKKIQSWKSKYGSFNTLEQLLDIDGFGVKILNKFCKSVLLANNSEKLHANPVKTTSKVGKRIVNFVYPNLNGTQINNIESFTSINVSPTMITWANFRLSKISNQRTNVINWAYFSIEDKKYHLNDLIHLIGEIDGLIPFADVYILENPPVIHNIGAPTAPIQINVNLQKSQILAMLSYMLANRNRNNSKKHGLDDDDDDEIQQKIYYMKSYVVARLFNTLVGNERVSTKSVVETLLRFNIHEIENVIEDASKQKESLNNDIHMDLSISQFYKNAENFPQEYMGRALLLGISFLRLCLINHNHS